MKYLIGLIACLLAFNVSAADSLAGDITSQGNSSYLHKNVTAQQLGATIRDYEDTTATNVLTYSECGKTIWLNSATEFATTLPAVEDLAGCYFKFIVKAAPASASYTIVTSGSANIIVIGVNELDVDTGDDGPYDDNADLVTLVDGVAVVGDYVECITDGTKWYCNGQTNADGGITTGTT